MIDAHERHMLPLSEIVMGSAVPFLAVDAPMAGRDGSNGFVETDDKAICSLTPNHYETPSNHNR